MDFGRWGRVFGYVRVDYRYIGFVNPKPAVSILATILIKHPASNNHIGGFTQGLCEPHGCRVFFIVTVVSSFIGVRVYVALLECRNHARRSSPGGYHRDQLRIRSRGDRPPGEAVGDAIFG